MGAVKVRFTLDMLRQLLHLDGNHTIVHIGDFDWWSKSVAVTIVGNDLPFVEEGAIPPDAEMLFHEIDGVIAKVEIIPNSTQEPITHV